MGYVILFLMPAIAGALVYVAGAALAARSGRAVAIAGLGGTGLAAGVGFLRLRDPGLNLVTDGDTIFALTLLAGVASGAIGALVGLWAPAWLVGLAIATLFPMTMWF